MHDTRFFGQPGVLATLFGVEMWERFSFYGMQGILLIYLYYSASKGGLGLEEATAAGIVGAYGGVVYLSTILGAWIADRLLGSERTLFYSAVVIMAGHIALALLPGFFGVGVGLPHRSRQRRAEGERDLARRCPLRPGRRTARRRILAVLPRHQPRRAGRPAADRPAQQDLGLPLRLRPRRDRHGGGPGPVRVRSPEPSRRRARRAQPAPGQAALAMRRRSRSPSRRWSCWR